MQLKRYQRGEVLFHDGDLSDRVFGVCRGLIKTYSEAGGGRKQILNIVAPGHFLGLESINNDYYPFSAQTVTNSDICIVRKDDLLASLQHNSDIAVEIMKALASELEYARDQVKILGFKGARRRVASFLLLFPCFLNAEVQEGVAMRIPLTRQEIAEFLGLTIETVSRVLGQFHSDKIININCTKVELIDIQQLRLLSE
jgi:CRP/FNR family transcriptional regulator